MSDSGIGTELNPLAVASGLTLTERSIEDAKKRIALLKKFVKAALKKDVDYGVIPGTQKESLYKPGAEKLTKMFGLGVRFPHKEKEIDLHANFAMFSYTAEAYNLATGVAIAQCEGSCNSQEKKYRSRKDGGVLVDTPIGDIMNTLQKMAQKRAYVGVIIQAVGASDFFTQDIDDPDDAKNAGIKAEPARASASVTPKATGAASTDQSSKAPICCERPMMVSKYDANNYYCPQCKGKTPIQAGGA